MVRFQFASGSVRFVNFSTGDTVYVCVHVTPIRTSCFSSVKLLLVPSRNMYTYTHCTEHAVMSVGGFCWCISHDHVRM